MASLQEALQRKKQYLVENKEYQRHENLIHRSATAGKYIGDLVYGANDGIITTFAVVAGTVGASLPHAVVLILGFANLFADGVSMGASNYLGKKSEKEFAKAQRKKEDWEIDHLRELEVEEIRDIYERKGFVGKDLDRAVEIITSNRKVWLDTMMKDELGIIEARDDDPKKHGIATFVAFLVAGIFPLLPYLLPNFPYAFSFSVAFGAAALFTVGALRSLVTTVSWQRGGIEMLFVGSLTGLVAYIIGAFVKGMVGI